MDTSEVQDLDLRLDVALSLMNKLQESMRAARAVRIVLPGGLDVDSLLRQGIHDAEMAEKRKTAALKLAMVLGITWEDRILDSDLLADLDGEAIYKLQVNVLEQLPKAIIALDVEKQMALALVSEIDSDDEYVRHESLDMLKLLGVVFSSNGVELNAKELAELDFESLFALQVNILAKLSDIPFPDSDIDEKEEMRRELVYGDLVSSVHREIEVESTARRRYFPLDTRAME